MKKVILYFLSAIGAFSLLVMIGLIWGISSFISSLSVTSVSSENQHLSSQSVLTLTVGAQPMMEANFYGGVTSLLQKQHGQSLLETLSAIREARKDPHIRAILLNIEGGNLSLSQADELRRELVKFQGKDQDNDSKAERKPIYVFTYAFSEMDNGTIPYYLASCADEIYMQKTGGLSVNGFVLQSFFLKNLFDDLKISVQSDRREKYKGVVEPFTKTAFSPPVKENLQAVLNDLFGYVQKNIMDSRQFSPSQMADLVALSPHLDDQAVERKYITALAYKDEVREKIKKQIASQKKESTEKVRFISVRSYLEQLVTKETSEKIGVIIIDGDITAPGDDPTAKSPFSPEGIDKAFKELKKKKEIKAVVLRINSPGGSVPGAEAMWHAVKRTVDLKIPVIVSMGGMAASAGYYIAAPATKIYALPTTLTGSIGVAFGKPNIREATEKYGVNWDEIEVGANGTMWSMVHDFPPDMWERLQKSVDHTYHQFKEKVSQGRKMDMDTVQSLAQGLVWTGRQAHKNRLVDEIGGFFEAVEEARVLGDIKASDPDLVILNQHSLAFSFLFDLLGTEAVEKLRLEVLKSLPQPGMESKIHMGVIR